MSVEGGGKLEYLMGTYMKNTMHTPHRPRTFRVVTSHHTTTDGRPLILYITVGQMFACVVISEHSIS